MSARGPVLLQIHRCNQYLIPQVRDVLTMYLYDDEPQQVLDGKADWLQDYRVSTAEELVRALVEADPSMVVEVYADDGETNTLLIHEPELGWFETVTCDGEPCVTRTEINAMFTDEPDDLMGWLDRRLGNPWYRAIQAIPQDDPNRLTKKENNA